MQKILFVQLLTEKFWQQQEAPVLHLQLAWEYPVQNYCIKIIVGHNESYFYRLTVRYFLSDLSDLTFNGCNLQNFYDQRFHLFKKV